MAANLSPLEDAEQIKFVGWLEDRGIRMTSIPNSTYTKSWKQKTHNRVTGLRPGFPDLVLIISPKQAYDGRGRLLTIEMKRKQGGVVSPEQRGWIAAINGIECDQVEGVVSRGADDAIEYVSGFLSPAALRVQIV